MKSLLVIIVLLISFSCRFESETEGSRVLKVPSQFITIADAVKHSKDGDTIIICSGNYFENNIEINRAVTILSEWMFKADKQNKGSVVIDAGDKELFIVKADGVEISGLKIINGDHPFSLSARVNINNNHLVNCRDGLSFESGSGGYAGYNLIENDRDDGIDIDIGTKMENIGSDVLIEYNTIINSHDDGMELRLFEWPGQNIRYEIRGNVIMGSNNAAVQLISYDVFTGKKFYIHHNIFRNCKTGLGCMEGARTKEDLTGASKMDEQVFLFNNTIVNNKMGATGGNCIIAINNIVMGNQLGGFKRFGKKSVVENNLFFDNGVDDFILFDENVTKDNNMFSVDPLLDITTFGVVENSLCVDAGLKKLSWNGKVILEVPERYTAGKAPDIGAVELNGKYNPVVQRHVVVEAGDDIIVIAPENEVILKGKVVNSIGGNVETIWKLENGQTDVAIIDVRKTETSVIFSKTGIYHFSLSTTGNSYHARDDVTIRFVSSGKGKKLFVDEKNGFSFDSEDYAYLYGNVSNISNTDSSESRYILLDTGDNVVSAFVEYSVGTSENKTCTIRLLVKKKDADMTSTLCTVFNGNKQKSVSISNIDEWQWIEVLTGVPVTAGQWPFWVYAESGAFYLKKIKIDFDD